MKRAICLLLLLALCLCACTQNTNAPTEPAEKLVYKTTTWADIDAIPIANNDMTEEELRQICVDFFRLQLSFQWTPKEPLSYRINTYQWDTSFDVGTVYAGCPYNSPATFGNLYVVMDYYDPETGLLDNSGMDSQAFASRIGNHCSSGPAWAWSRVINSVESFINSSMTPYNGYIPVGDFVCNTTSFVEGSTTMQICEENGKDVMYEAYAQVKPGDLMVQHEGEVSQTHVRMVAADPVIVRNPDGSIDPENSYVPTIHQRSGAAKQTVDGYEVIAQGGIDDPFSFERMYDKGNLVFTFAEFLGEDPIEPAEVHASFEAGQQINLRGLINGFLYSNYYISHMIVTLTDSDGEQVYQQSFYPQQDVDSRSRLYTAKIAEDPQIQALAEEGDLTLQIDCRISTGQVMTAWSGTLTK